jgi:hypothetical protein
MIKAKESKIFEEILDNMQPIVVNDVASDRGLAKDLFRYFSIKAHNLMLQPIIQK